MNHQEPFPVPIWVRITVCIVALILFVAVVAMPYFGISVPLFLTFTVGLFAGKISCMAYGEYSSSFRELK